MAAYNKKPVPDTSILDLIAKEEKAEGDKANSYSYKDLLMTKKLTRKTIFSCYIWFSCSVVYYAISFGLKNLSGDFYLNMLLMALTELPIWKTYLWFRSVPSNSRGMLWFGDIDTVRNLGYAAMNCGARIGGILAGQVLTLGGNKDLMVPFIALGIIVFLTVLATLGLDETKGKALEDTMKTFTSETPERGKLLIVEEQPSRPCDYQPDLLPDKDASLNGNKAVTKAKLKTSQTS
ncbi:solute carrier family 22 member 4-like [Haliotis rubra]|uniref:solute carrier family 22 member 4-like n=1 Tax=Haliotis rubra TaxID=36100 RepID=UPI001EE55709|nr:solute carrier family 22 member 4-like [Haliotis rubra]